MEKIEMYRTDDGILHEDKKEAEEHLSNKLCEELDKRLSEINKNLSSTDFSFKRHHLNEIVSFLMGDYQKAKVLIMNLYKIIED